MIGFVTAVGCSLRQGLVPWLQLTKTVLCLSVACSTAFGFALHQPIVEPAMVLATAGVFGLACGASAANSLQERAADRWYARTQRRPLVTGRLTVLQAVIASVLLVVSGLYTLLMASGTPQPAVLGLLTLATYNGLYTPLKGKNSLALLPGGLVGSLPPLIGWTAAGGSLLDPGAWLLGALFFLWQIPHFLLVLLHHRQDALQGPYPSLLKQFSESALRRIALVWLLALLHVTLAFPLLMPQLLPVARYLFVGMALCVLLLALLLSFGKRESRYHQLFIVLNGCFVAVMVLVILVQLLGRDFWSG